MPGTGRLWNKVEVRVLRRLYPSKPTAAIAHRLGRRAEVVYAKAANLGLHKTPEYLASPHAHRLDGMVGKATRFPKGHIPANKGLRRPGWFTGRMRETQFKKGRLSKRWDPEIYCIGALRINSDGELNIKLKTGLRAWYSMARWTWEQERGEIPAGMVVRFTNGDNHDTRIENLRLATRLEVMRENTLHNYPKPIARAIQLRGALNRRINKLEDDRAENS